MPDRRPPMARGGWLDAVFDEIGARKRCGAIEGLVREGEERIEQAPPAEVIEAGLIAEAQRVEHYEIAAYGTLRSFARTLGHKGAVKLLEGRRSRRRRRPTGS